MPAKPRAKSPAGDSFFANLAPETRRALLLLLQVIVIVEGAIFVFTPVLKGTWYGDDPLYISGNPLLYAPDRIWKAWFEPTSFIDYYPLEETVQYIQWLFFGGDSPFGYLVCNLILHAASALLLWRLFARLGLKYAWLGALLFAINPLFVDSVGNVAELKNTLSLPPILLAMTAWIDFEQMRRPRHYLLALAFYLASMFCKISGFFLPLVLPLYAWWKRGKITLGDVLASAPFLLVSVTLCYAHVHTSGVWATTHVSQPGPVYLGGLGDRIELVGQSIAFYFGHVFLPVPIMPYYRIWPLDPLTPLGFLPWIGIALVLAVCWIKRRSWGRAVFFALAFFVLGLGPFLGANKFTYMCLFWVSDHLLYLPIIPLLGLAIAAIEGIAAQVSARLRCAGAALLALIVALLGAQTHAYATLFPNQEQLWRYNLQYNPDFWMLHNLLGNELIRDGRLTDAIAEYRKSLRTNPGFDNAEMSLGLVLFKTGDFKGAIAAFRRCLEINAKYHAAQLYLGFVLSRDGQYDEAITQFRTFLAKRPNSADAHMGLGQALALQGHTAEGIAELQTAQRLDPGNEQIPDQIAALQARERAPAK